MPASLILADHCVSAQTAEDSGKGNPGADQAYANTCDSVGAKGRALNQKLKWHLDEVSKLAADTVWRMARLASDGDDFMCGLEPYALERIVHPEPASDPRFAWQDEAAAALEDAVEKAGGAPFLVFDLAGTGCGKTRMNIRAACIAAKSPEPRLSVALNLRTLTLQTGAALQEQLGLDGSDLATVIGDEATSLLFRKSREWEASGASEAPEAQFDAEGGAWPLPKWIDEFFTRPREKKIIGAPLLVSTIDFLIAAGDPGAQGHHVKALMRVMSSDLVLDEIDSYEPEALVAVLRVVQLAAFFGRNVICSSATLTKGTASAVETAFSSGMRMRRALFGGSDDSACAYVRFCANNLSEPEARFVGWDDEPDDSFMDYQKKMIGKLKQSEPLRIAEPALLASADTGSWLEAVADSAVRLHGAHHAADPKTGIRVSFGLVRVANIGPAVRTASFLCDKLPQARVACYHANDWLIERFNKERRLDFLLARKHGDGHIFADPEIRSILDDAAGRGGKDLLFIVVATPVEETGRDHDFDWAVVDASSVQSIVQTAGRVNRHRAMQVREPNVVIPQFNYRHCFNCEQGRPGDQAFVWPGYENKDSILHGEHDMTKLLPWKETASGLRLAIDASLRIGAGEPVQVSLARNDETAIVKALEPYFSRGGAYVAEPVPAQLMTQKFYDRTMLRGGGGEDDPWMIDFEDPDGGRPVVKHLEPSRRHASGEWVETEVETAPQKGHRPNAWLCMTPLEMRQMCMDFGISADRGMQAALHAFKGGNTPLKWIFDVDFGICKR